MKYILQFLTLFRRGTINPRASSSFSKEIDNSNLCEIDKIKVIFCFFNFVLSILILILSALILLQLSFIFNILFMIVTSLFNPSYLFIIFHFMLYHHLFLIHHLSILNTAVITLFNLIFFFLHPTSQILHPSSFILHSATFILHPLFFFLHPSSYIFNL